MNKLSKEQAEWLQDLLFKKHECFNGDLSKEWVEFDDIEDVINIYTEKEFPELNISILDIDNDQIGILNITDCKACGIPSLRMTITDTNINEKFAIDIGAKELKLLRDGIDKILEYIDETN